MKEQLYLQALANVLKTANETQDYTKENIKKIVIYGVKYTNTHCLVGVAETFYNLVIEIHDFIGFLTPNEFMNIFPVEKEYNGHKYECKDYFYTMEYLNTLERDKPIKDQNIDNGSVIGFLWEYHNWEVRRFTVALTTAIERMQMVQGLPTMFDSLGIETQTLYESNGSQFLLNANGRTTALRKPLPKYLRQLK